MPTIQDQITQDIKKAMIAKESERLNALRLLKSALDYAAIEVGGDKLDDAAVITILQKEAKKRQDAQEQFLKGDRPEQAAQEAAELELIQTYLPSPLSAEELEALVQKTIAEVGATSKKDMGRVIQAVRTASEGRADGKSISQAVGRLLPAG